MKKLIFLLALILCFCLSVKPQKQQTVNVFYGYTQYLSKSDFFQYPFNHNFGASFGFPLNEKNEIELGFSYNSKNYFSSNYFPSSIYGLIKYSKNTYINTIRFPQLNFLWNIISFSKNSFYLIWGYELLYITRGSDLKKEETISGDIIWQEKTDFTKNISKQIGLNVVFGIRYNKMIIDRFNFTIDITSHYSAREMWGAPTSGQTYSCDESRISFEPKIGLQYIINSNDYEK